MNHETCRLHSLIPDSDLAKLANVFALPPDELAAWLDSDTGALTRCPGCNQWRAGTCRCTIEAARLIEANRAAYNRTRGEKQRRHNLNWRRSAKGKIYYRDYRADHHQLWRRLRLQRRGRTAYERRIRAKLF